MAKLIVKDPKTGEEREMTERSFQLAGSKRGFKIVGKVEAPKSEIQKLMDQKRAEKASQQAETLAEKTVNVHAEPEPEVKEQKKRGPKPKNTEA